MAVAAENGFGVEFSLEPDSGGMVGGFFVALNAGVKCVATLELDADDVALGVVMGALGTLVHPSAVAGDDGSAAHLAESNRSTCSTPFTRLRR